MRHDPSLARAAAVHTMDCACTRCGPIVDVALAPSAPRSTRIFVTIAVVAFFLVPGRFLLVWLAPVAAPFLGFGR